MGTCARFPSSFQKDSGLDCHMVLCDQGLGRGHCCDLRPQGTLRLLWLFKGSRFSHPSRGASQIDLLQPRPLNPAPPARDPPGAGNCHKRAPTPDTKRWLHTSLRTSPSEAVGGCGHIQYQCKVHLTSVSAGHADAGGSLPPKGQAPPCRLSHTPRKATQVLGELPDPTEL